MTTYVLPLNPEPWTAPNVARRGPRSGVIVYKNEQLRTYQEAVKELLRQAGAAVEHPPGTRLSLRFYFWRRLDVLDRKTGTKASSSEADATNMQKATEDAIQGVLIDNDRNVVHVESWLMEQDRSTIPRVIIIVEAAPAAPPAPVVDEQSISPPAAAHDYTEAEGMF